MYFWNIKKLKEELIRDGLSQRSTFMYILVSVLLAQFFVTIGFLFPSKDAINAIDYIKPLIDLSVVGAGTYLCFCANGSGSGVQFAERYFSISFVVGLRSMVLVIPLALVTSFAAGIVKIAIGIDSVSSAIHYAILALVRVWLVIVYWRIVTHINDVAKAAHA
jgi:hypothetical protein